MISTMMLINFGMEALNSTSERHTFLELIHEYFLYSMLVVFSDDFLEQFLGLACMSEALIIVVDEEDALVLEINDPFFVNDHFYHIPFLDQPIGEVLLKNVHSFSDALHTLVFTLTNSMKISPLSLSLMNSASFLMNLNTFDGNNETKSEPSLINSS